MQLHSAFQSYINCCLLCTTIMIKYIFWLDIAASLISMIFFFFFFFPAVPSENYEWPLLVHIVGLSQHWFSEWGKNQLHFEWNIYMYIQKTTPELKIKKYKNWAWQGQKLHTLQKQVGCFNHKVVILVADKLERQWLWKVCFGVED